MSARFAIGLNTRRYLVGLLGPEGLDGPCLALLEQALEKAREVSPSGLVFHLAEELGASRESALAAGSFCELYYAMCSLTDDVQDGDAAAYLPGTTPAMQVNVALQLACVTVAAGGPLAQALGAPRALEELVHAFRAGATMLVGQRLELLREGWSLETYRRVATLSAGHQLAVYFRLAAAAAGRPAEPLLEVVWPLSLLIQIREDERSGDPRLLELQGWERMRDEAEASLQERLAALPDWARGPLRRLLDATLK